MTANKLELRARMVQGNGKPDFYVDPVDDETYDEFLQSIAVIAVESKSFTALAEIEDLSGNELRELTDLVANSMKQMREGRR